MEEHRVSKRLSPKDFIDYRVLLDTDGLVFEGTLGNISETGLCAIVPGNFPVEKNEEISGRILSEKFDLNISFDGSIAWKTKDLENDKKTLVGIAFQTKLTLTDQLFSAGMALEG